MKSWVVEVDLAIGLAVLALMSALSHSASSDEFTVKSIIAGVIMSTFVLALAWFALANSEVNETLRIVLAGVAGYSARYILAGWNIVMQQLANDPISAIKTLWKHWRNKS
ncbi:hypothetical protein [Shewanella halifaxensis]|uniref:hypothetical protein n=1 Tax=Shewanella halifaxensis TaxID=271098 RepID=UPI000D59CA0D|nr:hypothetical protein [Shewanella halifaxensis]